MIRFTKEDYRNHISSKCHKVIQYINEREYNTEMLKFFYREMCRIAVCLEPPPPCTYVDLGKAKGGRGTKGNPIGFKAFKRRMKTSTNNFRIKGSFLESNM